MSNDEFTRLFLYMQEMHKDMDAGFDKVWLAIDRIYGVFDLTNKEIENLDIEQLMMKRQADRHERWIRELAEKTDTKLSIELQ
jgi:hypothetical protein